MIDILQSCDSRVHSISRVIDEFHSGRDWGRDQSSLDASLRHDVAARLERRTKPVQSLPRISHRECIEASYQFGKIFGISETLGLEGAQLDTASRLAHLFLRGVFDERDSARNIAADLFENIGREYLRLRKKNNAGIAFTNSALAILEKFSVSRTELKNVHKRLVMAQDLRNKGVDWAYTEFQLGICERMQAQGDGYPTRVLLGAWERFQRARRVFARSEGFPEEMWYIFGKNLAETVECLVESLRREHLEAIYEIHGAELPEPLRNDFAGKEVEMMEMLILNPQACGLGEVPSWLNQEIDLTSIESHIKEAQDELSAASNILSEEGGDQIWWLQNRMANIGEVRRVNIFNALSSASLHLTWRKGDVQTYFSRAVTMIGAEIEEGLESAYFNVIQNLVRCVDTIQRDWSEEFAREFFVENGLRLRFLACELAANREWKDAFRVLEMTRGVAFMSQAHGLIENENMSAEDGGDKTDMVHLTHSPSHTAIIARSANGEYFGKVFPSTSGRRLAAIFSGLGDEKGFVTLLLTRPTGASREGLERSLGRVQELLVEVADFLSNDLTSKYLTIIPGGYYQVVPLGLYKNSNGGRVSDCITSCFMPAAWVTEKNRVTPDSCQPSCTVDFVDASNVSGLARLRYSPLEKIAVAGRNWSCRDVAPTKVDFLSALRSEGAALHFSGHSLADVNPFESALALSGSNLTVRDIVADKNNVNFVFLSSCESGLAYNAHETEDYLSIQSAFIYGGARAAIGTMWPVRDFTAFCFASRFYSELKALSNSSSKNWITAHKSTQIWMRRVTAGELLNFISAFEPGEELLTRLNSMPSDSKVFGSILDWCAFSVMGIL